MPFETKLLEFCLDGKLSDDKTDKLERLIALMDGRQDKGNAV